MDIIPKLHLAAERFRQYRQDKHQQNDREIEKIPDIDASKAGLKDGEECKDIKTPVSASHKVYAHRPGKIHVLTGGPINTMESCHPCYFLRSNDHSLITDTIYKRSVPVHITN